MAGITEYDISHKGTYTASRLKRYPKLEFNVYYINRLKNVFKVRKLVQQINPDILHLHTLIYPSYLGLFTGFNSLVISFWNGDIIWTSEGSGSMFRSLIIKYGVKKAKLITVDSNEMKDMCLKWDDSDSKVEIIQFGVDLNIFNPDIETQVLRAKLNIGNNSPVVLSTRSLGKICNIDIIIKSIPLVLEGIPSAKFLFTWHAGSEDEYNELFELAKDLNIINSVRFVGHLQNHNDLAQYYALGDVHISIPSHDTTPVSLLEAMAGGTAPVVGDLPSVKEWIKDSYNGYIVPLKDVKKTAEAITGLLKREPKRKLFSKRNIEIVREKADYDKEMMKMEELYFSLLTDRDCK